MFGKEFYPTPDFVIEKMLKPYKKGLYGRTILEPSAGKGDIANALNPVDEHHYYDLDCVEVNIDLVNVLQGNGHRVVAHDFLRFVPQKMYDLIVMNPPFSNGDAHLLHAWEILSGGDIVCLLNEETIQNPFSKTRKLLCELIRKYGEVEFLGSCFDTAERKTGVRVALVRLHKKQTDKYKGLFDQAHFTGNKETTFEKPEDIFLPASRNIIKTLVTQFNEALETYKKMLVMSARLDSAITGARGSSIYSSSSDRTYDSYIKEGLFSGDFKAAYNKFLKQLTTEAWDNVIQLTQLDQLMTSQVRKEFQSQMKLGQTLAFCEENIYALIDGLRGNVTQILTDALCEVFDYLTKFHKENREHVEGWKSNDRFKINKRFILPYVVKWCPIMKSFSFGHGRYQQMRDLDRVMCSLEGKKLNEIKTIEMAIRDSIRNGADGKAESEFFKIRYFKKNTAHFTFRDDSLRERFCIEYAKDKNWLPADYSYEKDGAILAALEEAA